MLDVLQGLTKAAKLALEQSAWELLFKIVGSDSSATYKNLACCATELCNNGLGKILLMTR